MSKLQDALNKNNKKKSALSQALESSTPVLDYMTENIGRSATFAFPKEFLPKTEEEAIKQAKQTAELRQSMLGESPVMKATAAFGAGAIDSATLGIFSKLQDKETKKFNESEYGKIFTQTANEYGGPNIQSVADVKALNKPASFLGSMVGYMAPYSAAKGVLGATKLGGLLGNVGSKLASPIASKLTGALGEKAATAIGSAIGGFATDRAIDIPIDVALGLTEGVIRKQDAKQIAQNIGTDLIFGTIIDFGINSYGGIKALRNVSTSAKEIVDNIDNTLKLASPENADQSVKLINDNIRKLSEVTDQELPLITIDNIIKSQEPGTALNKQTGSSLLSQKLSPDLKSTELDTVKGIDEKTGFTEADQGIEVLPFEPTKELGQEAQARTTADLGSQITSSTKDLTRDIKTEAQIKLVDDLAPLKDLNKDIYEKAITSRHAGGMSDQIFSKNLIDAKGNIIYDKGFTDMFSGMNKKAVDELENYMVQVHALEWMKQGKQVYPKDWDVTVPELELSIKDMLDSNPMLKDKADEIKNFYDSFNKAWLVDTGIISKDFYDKLRSIYPDYVPLRRQLESVRRGNKKVSGQSFVNVSSPIKKATGSELKIISPLMSMMQDMDRIVTIAKRNEVAQDIYKIVSENENAFDGLIKIVPVEKDLKESKDMISSLMQDLKKSDMEIDGNPYDKQIMDAINEIDAQFKKQVVDMNKTGSNIVTALVDGKKVKMEVTDKYLLDALTNLSPQGRSQILNGISKLTRTMKTLTTGINPVFSLARNIWRDIPTGYINSTTAGNPISYARDIVAAGAEIFADILPKNVKDSMYKALNISDDWAREFRNVGGGFAASPVGGSSSALGRARTKLGKGKNLFDVTIGNLEKLNDIIESAPRLAEYKRVKKAGGSATDALYAADEVTTNFLRKGTVSKELDQFVPYFNAAVQGLNKFAKTYKNNPVSATLKTLTAVTLPTMILYAVNHDDENYKQLSNWTKDNYYLIPKGDGTFWKIAKPREYGMIFSSFPERILRQFSEQDPEAFKGFSDALKSAFLPPNPLKDNILSPIITDIPANEDYAGRPIVPGTMEDRSPREQYDESTSSVAKVIGNVFNLSPKQIDYVIKSYGGVVGQLGVPLTSESGDVSKTLLSQITADPLYSTDVLSNFYNNKEDLSTQYNDAKATGDPVDTNLILDRRIVNKTSDVISDISDIAKRVNKGSVSQEDIDAISSITGMNYTEENSEEIARALREEINNIASTDYFTDINEDILNELNKIYQQEENSNIYPNGVPLTYKIGNKTVYITNDQREEISKSIATQINTLVGNYINSSYYKNINSEVATKKITNMVNSIEEKAYRTILGL